MHTQPAHLIRHSLFGVLVAAVLAVFLLGTSAYAVRPYTNQTYKQPKAPLDEGKNMKMLRTHTFRFKAGKVNEVSRGGVTPQFQRQHWSWGNRRRQR